MRWSLTIGRVFGVAVKVHVTFVLLIAWIAIAAWRGQGAAAALDSVVYILLLFACVVLHEFGHVLVARRFGIETNDVTLLPIGGVASLRRMPDTPMRELAVAIAGPAVNFAIALVLIVALGSFSALDMTNIANPGVSMVARLAEVNVFLAVFNLIPAFPMDGGRVLHALLAMRIGDERATDVAATIGQACAIGLGMLGLLGNPLLLFVAIFVYMAAAEEAHYSHLRHALSGLAVADVMETQALTLPLQATLRDAVEALRDTSQADFPIVDAFRKPIFMATRSAILLALQQEGDGDACGALPQSPAPTIRANASAQKALEAFQDQSAAALCVVDSDGALVGLPPRQALVENMLIRAARPNWRLTRRD